MNEHDVRATEWLHGAPLPLMPPPGWEHDEQAWLEAREAIRIKQWEEERARKQVDFWHPVPIKPIPMLERLRDLVIARSEKRMPKWKFRLAPDLVLQLQPKVSSTYAVSFEGRTIEIEGANGAMLLSKKERQGCLRLDFRLYKERDDAQDHWSFEPTRVTRREKMRLRDRVLVIFQGSYFHQLQPGNMLSAHCIICGKGLTDPASMANMIGPECRGSGSLNVRGLWNLEPEGD